MNIRDTQFTEDELAMMNGDTQPDNSNPPPSDEALQDAAVAAQDDAPAQEGQTGAEQEAQPTAADAQEQTDGFVPQFDGSAPADYDEQRKAIRAQKAELRQKWSSGELSDEEWASQETALDDQYESLREQYLVAQALTKANQQIQEQQQRETLKSIAATAKDAGIDYADPGLSALFDTRLAAVAAEDAFKGKPFQAIAAEANRRVLELFGKQSAGGRQAPAPAPAPAAKPNSMRNAIPPTLGNIPAAAAQPVGSDFDEQFAMIDDPDVAEARWASMSTQQRAGMLRSTMPVRR